MTIALSIQSASHESLDTCRRRGHVNSSIPSPVHPRSECQVFMWVDIHLHRTLGYDLPHSASLIAAPAFGGLTSPLARVGHAGLKWIPHGECGSQSQSGRLNIHERYTMSESKP